MNKKIVGIAGLFAISLFLAGTVFAYRGDPMAEGPNYDPETCGQVEAAMESGDYAEWVRLREENNLPMHGRMFHVINEENFNLFQQLHEAREEGDTETVNQIRQDLGLGQGKQFGNFGGSRLGKREMRGNIE